MKKILSFIIIVGVVFGIFYFLKNKEVVAPVITKMVEKNINVTNKKDVAQEEFCFAKFSTSNSNGNSDKYTLRLILNGEQVIGELNLLPAEEDPRTGEVKGVVGVFDQNTMTRTIDLDWFTFTGVTDTEKVKIILGKNTASVNQEKGTLSLPEVPCSNFGY